MASVATVENETTISVAIDEKYLLDMITSQD